MPEKPPTTTQGALGFRCETSPDDSGKPKITLDIQAYEHFLEDADLSDDQRREFLEALWSIICSFVELGFGVHPAQQAMAPEKKPADIASKTKSSQNNKKEEEARP